MHFFFVPRPATPSALTVLSYPGSFLSICSRPPLHRHSSPLSIERPLPCKRKTAFSQCHTLRLPLSFSSDSGLLLLLGGFSASALLAPQEHEETRLILPVLLLFLSSHVQCFDTKRGVDTDTRRHMFPWPKPRASQTPPTYRLSLSRARGEFTFSYAIDRFLFIVSLRHSLTRHSGETA